MLKVNHLSGFGRRNAGGGGVGPVAAFITATGISNGTIETALQDLYDSLVADSLWSKFHAIYPFVGASSSAHSYNLVDTALYQITWNGTVTHNSDGITPNGTTGYGDTGLNCSTVMTVNDAHIAFYSRTNSAAFRTEMGARTDASSDLRLTPKGADNNCYVEMWATANEMSASVAASTGLFVATRRGSTDAEVYRNGSSIATNTAAHSGTRPNLNIFIGAYNNAGSAGSLSDRNLAFATIGAGLTDTDAANMYTHVQAFQTALSRNV